MRRLFALAIVPVALAAFAGTAHADTDRSAPVRGSFLELGPLNVISDRFTPNGTEIIDSDHPIVFEGGLTGTSTSFEHTVIHADGTFTTDNLELFSGRVTGTSGHVLGTGTIDIVFIAVGDFTSNNGNGQFHAQWGIVGAGGALRGLHGGGTSVGEPGVPGGNGTFDGTVWS